MTQFAWTKILETWEVNEGETNKFIDLLRKRTLPAILQSTEISKMWKEYIKWLKSCFKKSSSTIDKVSKEVNSEIESLAQQSKIAELKDLIKNNFFSNEELKEAIKKDFEQQIDNNFSNELPGEGINLFRESALSLLSELKSNIAKYRVDELAFLSSLIQDIYVSDLPDKWQESWKLSEPHLVLANFGDDAKHTVNEFFKMIIHLLNELKIEDEDDIDKIQAQLPRASLKLADLVEEERRNELIRIKDKIQKIAVRLNDYIETIYADPEVIYSDN